MLEKVEEEKKRKQKREWSRREYNITLKDTFLWENILLLSFWTLKTYLKALLRRLDTSR